MNPPYSQEIEPVRVALVGLGGHGRTIRQASFDAPGLNVVTVCDLDADEANAAAEQFGCDVAPSYEALLARADVEAVVLVTPNHLHRPQAEAAFAAGKDVFVEKPIANTVADGVEMVEQAEAAGRLLMVGHNMRRGEAVRRARALLDAGRLGEIVTVEVHFSSDAALRLAPGSWRLRPEQCPLLPMMQLGIHGVDLVHYLAGPIQTVFAHARSITTPPGVVDSVTAQYTLEGGIHGTMISSYCSPVRFEYRIAGTEGLLTGTPQTLVFEPRTGGESVELDVTAAPFASYTAQMQAFAEAVRHRTVPETDGWGGVQALAVVEAMEMSIAQRAAVTVPTYQPETPTTGHAL